MSCTDIYDHDILHFVRSITTDILNNILHLARCILLISKWHFLSYTDIYVCDILHLARYVLINVVNKSWHFLSYIDIYVCDISHLARCVLINDVKKWMAFSVIYGHLCLYPIKNQICFDNDFCSLEKTYHNEIRKNSQFRISFTQFYHGIYMEFT